MLNRNKAVIIAICVLAGVFALLLLRFESINASPDEDEERKISAETDAQDKKGAYLPEKTPAIPDFRFLTEPGIYTETISVEIASPEGVDVYYTLDGNLPEEKFGEVTCKKYRDTGVKLVATRGGIGYYSFTAQYVKDGVWSDPIFDTYVVGAEADKRFTTLAVFITCEPDKLFGYESGILVAGKLRDDWQKEHPGEKPISISPAGFMQRGRDSEREINVQFFNVDGQSVINQKAGVRPYGAYTRAYKFKSIKLYARREYDEVNNKFRYDVFDGLPALNGEGRNVMTFDKLLLRSAGSDAGKGMMRDELHQDLSIQAGFPGGQAVTPVSVYINGEYYGAMWIHDVIDDEFFEQNYGYYEGEMAVASGPEKSKPDKRYDIDNFEEEQYFYDDWNEMYKKFSKLDMTVDSNYEEFCEVVDVENYLFYYAINTYVNNSDWPYNNHKAYRYYAAEGEEYREGTVFDGRWRFLPHDMDGFWDHKTDILNKYLLDPKQSRYSPLFGQLIRREDCRQYYVDRLMELMNGAFSADNYTATINRMHEERLSEAEIFLKTSQYAMTDVTNMRSNIQKFVNYAENRPASLVDDLKRAFGYSGVTYRVRIAKTENGCVKLGNWAYESEYNATFIKESKAVLKACAFEGYEFDHWTVNGTVYTTEEITLEYNNKKGEGFRVDVFFRPKEEKRLIISEYSAAGGNDYVEIYNPYDEEISMKGYRLSDSFNDLGRYTLPDFKVEPFGKKIIYCKNYTGPEKMHEMSCPFSFNKKETIYFSFGDTLLERIDVADLRDGYKAVRDLKTGRFIETKK